MQFFTNPASPFCRKVDIVLRETGQRDMVTETAAVGHPTAPDTMPRDFNPLGKIPVLVQDDGSAIYDSRVICRFLDDRAQAGLYPEDRLWDVLTLEATGDGIADAAVLMVYESRSRPEDMVYAPWVEGQWDKIARSLTVVENRFMDLLEAPLNIGQISLGTALGYLDFRHGARGWRDDHKALADWYADFAARASMVATAPQ